MINYDINHLLFFVFLVFNLIDFFAMCGKINYKDSIGKSLVNDKSVGGLL